ncbi:MAG TPA: DUF6788 family protein [Blastocatellia bacterium]|nr:DUF6788 family protein [Blastocatellia bacterium]
MNLLHKIISGCERLSHPDLVKLDKVIHKLTEKHEREELKIPERAGREVVQREKVGHITYQLERIRCGKTNCKCAAGELHGPYWYSYWSQNGKTKSAYVGKKR